MTPSPGSNIDANELFPFTPDPAPVANTTPGSFVFLDSRGLEFPVNHVIITNESGQDLFVKLCAGMSPLDIVTTGDFASDTGWDVGAGWTIAAGIADIDTLTPTQVLRQTTLDAAYEAAAAAGRIRSLLVVYDVLNYASGNIRFFIGKLVDNTAMDGVALGAARTADATYTERIRMPKEAALRGGVWQYGWQPNGDVDMAVDNVAVYPDGVNATNYDVQIPDGSRYVVQPNQGLSMSRINVWCPTSATEENIQVAGAYCPNRKR